MSLHTLANHLQSAGRGEDKVLVHMTPGEVNGLQSLAMAHGGSLTLNPETGLPEAGFLRSLLPMIAGAGLSMIPGVGPMMAAGIVGGGTALATGSLEKGLMAGLGAYGGAGLTSGLSAMGAGAGAQGAAGAGSGLTPTTAGVSLQNTGATVGVNASPNMFSNVANVADDVGYAGFKNPVLDAGFKNPVALTAPPAAPSVVTNASAYSPASNFNVGQNLSGVGTQAPIATSNTVPTTLAGREANLNVLADQVGGFDVTGGVSKASRPPSLLDLKAGARQSYPDLSTLKYGGGYVRTPDGRFFIENPLQGSSAAKVPGYTPSTATTSRPFAGGLQGTTAPSGAVDVSGQSITRPFTDRMSQVGRGFEASTKDFEGLKGLYNAMPFGSVVASGLTLAEAMKPEKLKEQKDKSLIRPYDFDYGATGVASEPYTGSAERMHFNPMFTARTPYEAPGREYAAAGGLMGYAAGGPVGQMANMNYVGMNTGYPMASLQTPMYSNPTMQTPEATNVIAPSADAGVGAYTGEQRFAAGGISDLGGYSDGGRLLRGPGDGVSDSIPASIGNRQPARLADGEFVVPARIVSELGNGSTEAGARKLYAMMDRIQKGRRKSVGKGKVAVDSKASKHLPA